MGTLSVAVNLSFKPESVDSDIEFYTDIESSALYKMLPAIAKEYIKANPHLLEYLHMFSVNTSDISLFLSELKKDLRSMKSPNITYPVNETTFIHILPDPDGVQNFYIPIEPSFLHSVNDILPVIETKLIDLIDGLEDDPISDKERAEVIKKMLANVAVIRAKSVDLIQMQGSKDQQDLKSKITRLLKTDFTAQKEEGKDKKTPPGTYNTGWEGYSHK